MGTGWRPVVWLPRLCGISHSNLVFEPNTDGTSPGKREGKLIFWEKPPSPPAFPWDVSEAGLSARAPIMSHLAASLNSHCFLVPFRTSPWPPPSVSSVLPSSHGLISDSQDHTPTLSLALDLPQPNSGSDNCPRSHFPPLPGARCASSAEETTSVSISSNL